MGETARDERSLKTESAGLLDEELARARTGDQRAFAMLVRAHQRSVYSLALRMLTDSGAAEDLAQEVFLQLHRNLPSIESGAHLSFWLRKAATHRAIDRLRQPQMQAAAIEEAEALGVQIEDDPLLQRQLGRLIVELSPAARAVMLLRFQEDLDPLDIARTLDMPINTVKSHLKRSLATLRERVLEADVRREGNLI